MKKVFTILLVFCCWFSAFAAQGALWGEKNIKVVSTKYFEICYPESCEEGAELLFENADGIYEKLAEMYGYEIQVRIPVTLTSSVELYNAYFTEAFYNRILLYVAPPIDECNVEPDNLLKTFQHELTHAYTYNMKTKFWRGIANLFGDAISPHYWLLTSGLAEGATMTSESSDGNGRLNDEYAKQPVKQAKIEDKFPAFNDVQGSRTIYPRGSFYYFNGAFNQWLQEKYGMEKYAQWWFRCVNVKNFSIRGAFKKVYGIKLTAAWEQFKADYEIPEVESNPVKAELVQDFYSKSAEKYSLWNKQGALPESLSLSEKGLVYMDAKTSGVFFVPTEDLKKDRIRPKKLFSVQGVSYVSQSADGRFIAVNFYDQKRPTYRYFVDIYDTEKECWFKNNSTGIQNATIVKDGEDYYQVALKFCGEDWNIQISKIEFSATGKISGLKDFSKIDYNRFEYPEYFAGLKDGKFAYALKSVMDYTICIADVNGEVLEEIETPYERMVVRYLSYCEPENSLYYSWTKPGSMPRLGKYELSTGSFFEDNQELSGGIYYPVKSDEDILFAGSFYTSNRIFTEKENAHTLVAIVQEEENTEGVEEVEEVKTYETGFTYSNPELDSRKYNPFEFYQRGIFVPFGLMETTSYDPKHKVSASFPVGISYFTSNPWSSNQISGVIGYSPKINAAGFKLAYQNGTDTSLFNYSFSGSTEFDRYGWKQADLVAGISSGIPLGHISSVYISPQSLYHVGRSNASKEEAKKRTYDLTQTDSQVFSIGKFRFGEYECVDLTNYVFNLDQIVMYYQAKVRSFDNDLGVSSLLFGLVPYYMYNATLDGSEVFTNVFDVTFFSFARVPALLPFRCVENFTYNLPAQFLFGLFSADTIGESFSSAYSFPTLAYVNAEVVLFGMEVQKSIKFLPFFYINNFRFSLGGVYGYEYDTDTANQSLRFLNIADYYNGIVKNSFSETWSISLKAELGCVPYNFGAFANSGAMLKTYTAYNYFYEAGETDYEFTFGLDASF